MEVSLSRRCEVFVLVVRRWHVICLAKKRFNFRNFANDDGFCELDNGENSSVLSSIQFCCWVICNWRAYECRLLRVTQKEASYVPALSQIVVLHPLASRCRAFGCRMQRHSGHPDHFKPERGNCACLCRGHGCSYGECHVVFCAGKQHHRN